MTPYVWEKDSPSTDGYIPIYSKVPVHSISKGKLETVSIEADTYYYLKSNGTISTGLAVDNTLSYYSQEISNPSIFIGYQDGESISGVSAFVIGAAFYNYGAEESNFTVSFMDVLQGQSGSNATYYVSVPAGSTVYVTATTDMGIAIGISRSESQTISVDYSLFSIKIFSKEKITSDKHYFVFDGTGLSKVKEMTDDDGNVYPIIVRTASTSFTTTSQYKSFDSGISGIEMYEAINGCTLAAQYDGRIFFSGNPKLPNTVFFTARDSTGYNNPTYIGVLNWLDVGVSGVPVTSLLSTESNLIVFKGDTVTDASIVFLSGFDTSDDILPRFYSRTDGLSGIGCCGCSCNFLDDSVFLSKNGLNSIDKQTISLERSVGHRSSNVDARLLQEDLIHASVAEWLGYLVLAFPNGHVYLADSRQVSTVLGSSQYEWYYLEEVGAYSEDKDVYRYESGFSSDAYVDGKGYPYKATIGGQPLELKESAKGEMPFGYDVYPESYSSILSAVPTYTYADDTTADGESVAYIKETDEDGTEHLYLLGKTTEKTGGTFHPAIIVAAFADTLLLGTENGDILICNTDKRGEEESSVIPAKYYSICGHRFYSGIDTVSENAGVPHLTKDTSKKSTVIEFKPMYNSRAKVQIRTDRETWSEPVSVTASKTDYGDLFLGAQSFDTNEEAASVAVKEKTKKWVKKQYRVYSDEYCSPFGIYSISYRFSIHGRIKN